MSDRNSAQPRPMPPPQAPKPEEMVKPEEAAPPPRLSEVQLLYKYCPHDIVNADGTLTPNGDPATGETQTIPPGIVKLSAKDALHTLRMRVAIPTQNTEF